MCGILGLYSINNINNNFDVSLNMLNHRGPNYSSKKVFRTNHGTIILGHARLSIIDLNDNANQPMMFKNNTFSIVFNGEIYNYIELRNELISYGYEFKTNSDTEVLLASWDKWGKQCLSKLNGMFSFVIINFETNTIYCCRDAYGIKPFYYFIDDSKFMFSSEINPLINLDQSLNKLNLSRAQNYLINSYYDNNSDTFFQDIKSLLPGSFIEIDLNNKLKYEITKWWNPIIKENLNISFEDAKDAIRNMFLDNVKLNMRSDVPIGAALSGGIDSSAIVCAMRYLDPKLEINTFSFIENTPNLNEDKWVDIVNKFIKAKAHKIYLNSNNLKDELDDMIISQGEPFMSTSIYAQYCIYKKVKYSNVTVTLDGQGADELLAGYDGYPISYLQSLKDQKEYFKIINFIYNWSKWPGRGNKQAIFRLIATFVPPFLHKQAFILIRKTNIDWFNFSNKIDFNNTNFDFDDNQETFGRKLISRLRKEQTIGGLQALLRHGDRNSMKWSIESRVPFLSTNFSELIFSLPESYLVNNQGRTKNIFREAMRGIVPDQILDRKDKIGFTTPEFNWLKDLKPTILEWLNYTNDISFINSKSCIEDVNNILSGKKQYTSNVWRLINFTRWAQINNIKI